MKVLIVNSLYSALINSIIKKKWHPQGMPSYTKLIERLENRKVNFDVVLISRNYNAAIRKKQIVRIDGFSADFHVLTFPDRLRGLKKLRIFDPVVELILDIMCGIYCVMLCNRKDYDVYYFDRANVTIAAFFAFFHRKKVFLRLHGVISLFNQFKRRRTRFINLIKYVSFYAPFKYIICSKDGTPGESFLKRFSNKKVPYEVLLNGVDMPSESINDHDNIRKQYGIPDGVPVILFIGRLEKSKGCNQFIQSLIKLNEKNKKFVSLVIGDGSLYEELSALIALHNLSDKIILIGTIEHKYIYKYYEASDIYVSLNHHGNLSNTVLEAINSGNCIVTFSRCEVTRRDEDTQEFLKDCSVLIDRNNVLEELPVVLNKLIENPQKVTAFKKKTLMLSKKHLQTWEQRIDYEIDLLERIGSGNNLPV